MRRFLCLFMCLLLGCVLAAGNQPASRGMTKTVSKPLDISGLRKIDHALGGHEKKSALLWYDAKYLLIEGKGWKGTEHLFERLPVRARDKVTTAVWNLSKDTAGIAVRFVTDSKVIGAYWDGGGAMNHMAATGNSGLDLYVRRKDTWEFCGVGRPNITTTTATLVNNLPGKPAEYLLYLPLYNKVKDLKVGVTPVAFLAPAPERPAERRPLVFYGTSITQGGCASRAGMCHAAILGRWLDREVINLGFSGAGKMEPVIADLLCELSPSVYILECLPNMTTDMVKERVKPFVRTLRHAHPETPILLVENLLLRRDNPQNLALKTAYKNLQKEGVKYLYYLPADNQLAGRENGTVDGVHPTDLGFFRMATAYAPALGAILKKTGKGR
ncbi:MAG: SGNH/GDSL hydrolase family protein [Candidatus Sumerlaeota bacterium]|nr:SGNH/GDSL hydrolase family protein [Candidatus Sumerlaeota bacterium]